jgi:hypothetical protein
MSVLLNAYFQDSTRFADIISVTIRGNTIHILPFLLHLSAWYSCHQCPAECTYSFGNIPDIKVVPSTLEFLGYTPNAGCYCRDGVSRIYP